MRSAQAAPGVTASTGRRSPALNPGSDGSGKAELSECLAVRMLGGPNAESSNAEPPESQAVRRNRPGCREVEMTHGRHRPVWPARRRASRRPWRCVSPAGKPGSSPQRGGPAAGSAQARGLPPDRERAVSPAIAARRPLVLTGACPGSNPRSATGVTAHAEAVASGDPAPPALRAKSRHAPRSRRGRINAAARSGRQPAESPGPG